MLKGRLLTEANSIVSLRKEVNESVNINGIKDIKELYPEVYNIIKDIEGIENSNPYAVSLFKDKKMVVSISLYLVADRGSDELGKIDIEKLYKVYSQLKENPKVKDVYLLDGLRIEIEL